jgi:hypothetical protein
MHRSRLIAVSALVAIGLAACGSSSKGASGSNNSSTTTAPSSATTSAPSGTPTTQKVSGNSNSNFCQEVRNSENAFKPISPTSINPDSIKTEFENVGSQLQKAVDAAPNEIKPDFETFIHAYQPYLDALKAANYDFTKINFASLTQLDSASVKAATAHLEAYFTQVCHVTTPTSPTVSVP